LYLWQTKATRSERNFTRGDKDHHLGQTITIGQVMDRH
jgi:hypothetical protein